MRATLPGWDEYASMWARLHGGGDPRRARITVAAWMRLGYATAVLCARLRIRPAGVTALGLTACVLVPVFATRGPGSLLLAALMVVIAAAADTVDGALAIITGRTTRLGYVYDSVVDRLGELVWLVGFWRIGVPAYAVVIAGALSWLHEYARARANAAGMTEIGGATLGERPTRVILAAGGFGLAGIVGLRNPDVGSGVASFAVATWIVLSLIGFAQLFATIHRALAGRAWPPWSVPGKPPPPAPPPALKPSAKTFAATEPATQPAAEPVTEPAADAKRRSRPATVADHELLREISALDKLPGSSAIYTSTSGSITEEHGVDDGSPA